MKIHKKFLLFLAILAACLSIFHIIEIYAKYVTSASQTTNIPIARWNIKVNTTSIKNNETLSSIIKPVFAGSEHIASNIIAPTAEGYFDLDLDFSESDVSFSYDISISANSESAVSDLVITGYSIDGSTEIISSEGDTTNITDTITYNSGITSRSIRVYFVWDDSESASMDNASDTAATFDTSTGALLDVKITFSQVV